VTFPLDRGRLDEAMTLRCSAASFIDSIHAMVSTSFRERWAPPGMKL
jgi:hypothetical protein